jgi:hypothetical protein
LGQARLGPGSVRRDDHEAAQTWSRARAFAERDLSTADYIYLWADGIHVNVRLEEAGLCLLVMIVRGDGRKELALTDGYREATESGGSAARLPAAGCALRCWRSATALGSGARCGGVPRDP